MGEGEGGGSNGEKVNGVIHKQRTQSSIADRYASEDEVETLIWADVLQG